MNTDKVRILSVTLTVLLVVSAIPVGDLGFVGTAAANHGGGHSGDMYTLSQPGTGVCYEVESFTYQHEKMVPEVRVRGSNDYGDVTGPYEDPYWNGPTTIESIMDYRYRHYPDGSDGAVGQTSYYAPYLNNQYRYEGWEFGTYGLYNWSENGDSHLWFYENARGEVSLVIRHDKLYDDVSTSSHGPYNGLSGPYDGFFEQAPGDGEVTWEFDSLPRGEWAYIDDMYPEGLDDYYVDGNGVRYGHREAEYESEPLREFSGGYFSIEWVWNSWTTNDSVQHGTDGGAYRGFHNLGYGESVTITNSFSGDIDQWEVRHNDGSTDGTQLDLEMGEELVIERGAGCPDVPSVSLDMNSDNPVEAGETVRFVADTTAASADYNWDLDGDGAYDDQTTSAPSVDYTFADNTSRTVGVEMVTSSGYTNQATLDVAVAESQSPTARMNVESGDSGLDDYNIVGEELTFDATASSDNSGSLASEVNWEFGDGTSITADTRVGHSYDETGVYNVTATVSDTAGNTDTVERTVEIVGEDTDSPTVRADVSPVEVEAGAPLTFDGSESEDNRRITEYRWNFDGDEQFEEATANATIQRAPYGSSGDYNVTLEVEDGNGNVNSTTVPVTVLERAPPNITDVSVPQRVATDQTFSLEASATDDGRISEYRWLIDGEDQLTGDTATYRFGEDVSEPREHTIQLVVIDAAGERVSSEARTVTVLPPDTSPPNATLSVSTNETRVGNSVEFNASNSTDLPHRDIARFHWDFDGNGTIDLVTTDPVVTHEYGETGTYNATVTVEDGSENNATAGPIEIEVDEQRQAQSGGGGGGSTGSVSLGPPPVVTDTEQTGPNEAVIDVRSGRADETVRSELPASESAETTGVAFEDLAVNLGGDEPHVVFRTAASADTPADVSDVTASGDAAALTAPDETLAYLDLDADYMKTEVEDATVTFTVQESALGDYPAPSDVTVYQYDGSWTQLNATVVDSSGDTYRFETTADSLGTLAVGTSQSLRVTDAGLATESVTADETVEATATVENDGPTDRTLTLDFVLSGDVLDSATVEVPAGETREVTFSGTAPTPGSYEATVADRSAGTLTVEEIPPADVAVTEVSLNRSTIEAGDSAEITATVENTGGQSGEQTVTLTMFGEQVASETVTVAPGETEQVSFVRTVTAAGSYSVVVNDETVTLDVEDSQGSDDDSDETGPQGTGVPGFGVGAAIFALVAAVVLSRMRR